jgi:hypothetical protein
MAGSKQTRAPKRTLTTKVTVSFAHPKKKGQFVLRKYKLPSGKYFELKDINGEPIVYTFRDTTVFNMSDPFEKMVVEGLKQHPIYAEKLKFDDRREAAEGSLSKSVRKSMAFDIIQNLGNSKVSFGRALGLPVGRKSMLEVHALLIEEADRNADPKKPDPRFKVNGFDRVIDLHEDAQLANKILLTDGQSVGVFQVMNNVWYWEERVMGNNFEQALNWLDSNPDIVDGLKRTVDDKLADTIPLS